MTVAVNQALLPISQLIQMMCGNVLSEKDCSLFDYCQTLGSVYVGTIDGNFVCCWGLIPPTFLSQQAYLWMWAPEPIKHQFVFIRQSQIQVQKMLDRYDRIVGHCMSAAKSSQRWLKWLGAEFEPADGDVVPFTIRRAHG